MKRENEKRRKTILRQKQKLEHSISKPINQSQYMNSTELLLKRDWDSIMKEFEIDFQSLSIIKVVGTGNFGTVSLATFQNQNVAVKQLHPSASGVDDIKKSIKEFLSEVKVKKKSEEEEKYIYNNNNKDIKV